MIKILFDMSHWNWSAISAVASSLSTVTAMCVFIYTLIKNRNDKKPRYGIEITNHFDQKRMVTISYIRNVGNRTTAIGNLCLINKYSILRSPYRLNYGENSKEFTINNSEKVTLPFLIEEGGIATVSMTVSNEKEVNNRSIEVTTLDGTYCKAFKAD